MEVKYCERVKGNALFSLNNIPKDEIIFSLKGEITTSPTKYTIEIGIKQHIYDEWGIYMNHSFNPTTRIEGKNVISIRDIQIGDELNFNYNISETKMASPFDTNEGFVGGKVNSIEI